MIHMRTFHKFELENFRTIANLGIRYTTFQTYWTALDKGYFDAIAPIRAYFVEEGIHDYSIQGQGQINKEYREGFLLTATLAIPAKASMYRPKAKNGDPRLWFSCLHKYAKADDIFAMFHMGATLYIINVTTTDVKKCIDSVLDNPIKDILLTLQNQGLEFTKQLL